MTLETYEYAGQGVVQNRLIACPFCGYEFTHSEARWKHFYRHHSPEDAGLSPLGTVSDEYDGPLWESPDFGGEAETERV